MYIAVVVVKGDDQQVDRPSRCHIERAGAVDRQRVDDPDRDPHPGVAVAWERVEAHVELQCGTRPAVPVICAAAFAVNVVVPPGETNVQPTCEGPSGGGHWYGAAHANPATTNSTANSTYLTAHSRDGLAALMVSLPVAAGNACASL
jgi:hypothetical protein